MLVDFYNGTHIYAFTTDVANRFVHISSFFAHLYMEVSDVSRNFFNFGIGE